MENKKVVDLTAKKANTNGATTRQRVNTNTADNCRFKIEVTTLEGTATVTDLRDGIIYKVPMDKHRIFRNGVELIEQYVHTDGIPGCTNKGRFTMPRKIPFTIENGKKTIKKSDIHQVAYSNLSGRGSSDFSFEII